MLAVLYKSLIDLVQSLRKGLGNRPCALDSIVRLWKSGQRRETGIATLGHDRRVSALVFDLGNLQRIAMLQELISARL
jgi:hypothetical protein